MSSLLTLIHGGANSHPIAIDTERVVIRATQVLLTPIGHVACYEPAGKFCDGERGKEFSSLGT